MTYLLPQSVLEAASSAPSHEAFRAGKESLSYEELALSQDKLASWLSLTGLKRGGRVAIFCRRSLQSAIGVYGVMRAGGGFVPVDPDASQGWIEEVIRACQISHLVCDSKTGGVVRGLLEANSLPILHVLGLSSDDADSWRGIEWRELSAFTDGSFDGQDSIESDLAYIMYTSGSTGPPKGIMHTHYSGLSYARLSADLYGLHSQDRIANHSPLHFDMSTLGYLTAPLVGATTVLVPEAYTRFPASLSLLIERERISIWYSVPTALTQLLLHGVLAQRDCHALRWVLYGGEAFSVRQLKQLMDQWPQAEFSNVYGPAEVNQCTYFHIDRDCLADIAPGGAVPIGSVWSNTRALLVNAHDEPIENDTEIGELLISSSTMMRGYWNNPELTEASFYREKCEGGFDRLYYRTGDLVRRDQAGKLHFGGRRDRQIKYRGYRIELDGIEGLLMDHPQVQEAAVYLVPEPTGEGDESEGGIEAAVTLVERGDGCSEVLSDFLSSKLPRYSVPNRILVLEAFPRTGSGKIDRKALARDALSR